MASVANAASPAPAATAGTSNSPNTFPAPTTNSSTTETPVLGPQPTDNSLSDAEEMVSVLKPGSMPKRKKHKKINIKHPEFELTYDMMLGIRTTVGQVESKPVRDLTVSDFKEAVKLRLPSEGSSLTPAHQMRDFKFKDYAPEVFRAIRRHFGIKPADYLLCVCGNFQFLEFISNSKSGQFFFYTHDRQYMIKTVTQAESKYLRKILHHYYHHIVNNPNTLLTRFYGMHRVKPHKKKEVHFLIFGSVFFQSRYIHSSFDLKGSSQGRSASDAEKQVSEPVLKDNDFLDRGVRIRVGPAKAKLLKDQIDKDVEFLRQLNIMDYSLLLGVHDSRKKIPSPRRRDRVDSHADEQETEDEVEDVVSNNRRPQSPTPNNNNNNANNSNHLSTHSNNSSPRNQAPPRERAFSHDSGAAAHSPRPASPVAGSPGDGIDKIEMVAPSQLTISVSDASPNASPNAESNARTSSDADEKAPSPDHNSKLARSQSHSEAGHVRRQSNYGLPPSYNKFSKPEDIAFVAPEIDIPDIKAQEDKNRVVHSVFTSDGGGTHSMEPNGQAGPEYYYFGIIDILTTYGVKKRFEHFGKSLKYDSLSISAVNPKDYAKRFRQFMNAAIE